MKGESPYTYVDGNLLLNPSMFDSECPVFECTEDCSCNCPLRVVQTASHPAVEVRPAGPKGCGVFALTDILRGTFVTNYLGEYISSSVADRRFAARRGEANYVFVLKEASRDRVLKTIIDSTNKGNFSRFFNHSCDPNMKAIPVRTTSLVPWVALFACRSISAGEELTFSYGPPALDSGVPCVCGSSLCSGFLPFDP